MAADDWEINFPISFKYFVVKNPYRNENELYWYSNTFNIMKYEM